MEPLMYAALCNDTSTETTKNLGLSDAERRKWNKRLKQFTGHDGALYWQGKIVPTVKQVDEVLRPVHLAADGKHCKWIKALRKALSDKNFALPPFLGGLERACSL